MTALNSAAGGDCATNEAGSDAASGAANASYLSAQQELSEADSTVIAQRIIQLYLLADSQKVPSTPAAPGLSNSESSNRCRHLSSP